MAFFPKKYMHEVFLSHAVEDRAAIVDELYNRLDKAGIKVWFSANALTTGEDLKKEIEEAIEASRFGVIVFSKSSINRQWMIMELNWLELKEDANTKVILPFLYDMTIQEFAAVYPRLASRFCIHSSRGLSFAVEKILQPVVEERALMKSRMRKRWSIISVVVLAAVLAVSIASYVVVNDRPTPEDVNFAINERIQKQVNSIINNYIEPFKRKSKVVQKTKIDSTKTAYQAFKSYFRNEYGFNDGFSVIRARKNVEEAIKQNVVEISDAPSYGMKAPDIYMSDVDMTNGFRQISFSLINTQPVGFRWTGTKTGAVYTAKVNYTNGIQYINVSLTTPPTSSGTKRHEMTLIGFPPAEIFIFEKDTEGEWQLKEVRGGS